MRNRKLLLKLVQKAVDQSFEKDRIDGSKVKKIVETFKRQSLNEAVFCLENYLKLLRQEFSRRQVVVYSASKLNTDEQEQIMRQVNLKFQISNLKFEVDPSLLGGVKIKIGDDIYDNSVSAKVNKVKEAILS